MIWHDCSCILSFLTANFFIRCFVKSLPRSLFYMARDMACVLALQYVYPLYVAGNWPLTFIWWNANGFMLWALFVIGESTIAPTLIILLVVGIVLRGCFCTVNSSIFG